MGLDMGFIVNGKEVVYMRKANMVRKFFESNAPNFKDNGITPIDTTLIEDLLEAIEHVFDDDINFMTKLIIVENQATTGEAYCSFVDTINEMLKTPRGQSLIEKAEEWLPTQSGFFFGEVAYNACYFLQLLSVYKDIQRHKDELTDPDNDVEYYEWY